MDLDALRFADFSKLSTAVADWTAMATKLWGLESDARGDLGGKAAKADWAGVNATVTREFIGKTAKEFSDAAHRQRPVRPRRPADLRRHAPQHQGRQHRTGGHGRRPGLCGHRSRPQQHDNASRRPHT